VDSRLVRLGTFSPANNGTSLMTDRPAKHRAVMDLGRDEWLKAVRMEPGLIPTAEFTESRNF